MNRDGANGVINVRINLREKHVVDIDIGLGLYEQNALLSEVIAVLVDHSSDCNILRDNCYQYADNMFRIVVKRYGIDVALSEEMRATLQRCLDNHPRPVLPKDVLKKRYAAGAVVGTGVAAAAVAIVAVVNWPYTLLGLCFAPEALCLTSGAIMSGAISSIPAFLMGGYAKKRLVDVLKEL